MHWKAQHIGWFYGGRISSFAWYKMFVSGPHRTEALFGGKLLYPSLGPGSGSESES